MRRIEVETVEERRIRAPIDAVRARLDDIEGAIWLLPSVSLVEVERVGADDSPEGSRYRVHLGPFGVRNFSGTIRLELGVVSPGGALGAAPVALRLESVPGGGNTDARIAFEARADGATATFVRCSVWACPRKDIPVLLPISLVRRAATGVLHAGVGDALDGFAASFGVSSGAGLAPARGQG